MDDRCTKVKYIQLLNEQSRVPNLVLCRRHNACSGEGARCWLSLLRKEPDAVLVNDFDDVLAWRDGETRCHLRQTPLDDEHRLVKRKVRLPPLVHETGCEHASISERCGVLLVKRREVVEVIQGGLTFVETCKQQVGLVRSLAQRRREFTAEEVGDRLGGQDCAVVSKPVEFDVGDRKLAEVGGVAWFARDGEHLRVVDFHDFILLLFHDDDTASCVRV
mmetsp:Transcript_5408/g.14065  ORF Transcript_5408/g.14065 Transcript_5408/m.14065 type:complete len:219 (-) Transcript_5408:73-729(-)